MLPQLDAPLLSTHTSRNAICRLYIVNTFTLESIEHPLIYTPPDIRSPPPTSGWLGVSRRLQLSRSNLSYSPPGCPHLEPSSRDHWTNPGRSVTPLSCSLHVGLLAVSRMLCRIKRTVIFSPRSPPPPPFLFLLIFNIPFFLQSSRLNFLSETISVGVLEKCCIVQNDSHTCCLSWVYCVQGTSSLTSDCFIRLLGWLAGAGQVRSVHTNRVQRSYYFTWTDLRERSSCRRRR